MKYLFIVQGEGRGHLTQAISLRNILIKNGHEITKIIVGKSTRREIPKFFSEKINSDIVPVESPNFITDKKNIRIRIARTILYNLFYSRRFINSLKTIKRIVDAEKPDIIVNFYDTLGGLFYLFYKVDIPYFCIGHQYLIFHPEFTFPKNHKLDQFLLKFHARLTSINATKRLALSFRPMTDNFDKNGVVVPPLLRKEVFDKKVIAEGFIHGYILNDGYANEIIEWHKDNTDIKLHFFWDKLDALDETTYHNNLIFHKIDDEKFLDYLSRCYGYSSTAGFESICEAMYMGKPIMMIPTAGHYEQMCNALDASLSGAGIISESFDLSRFSEYIPTHNHNNNEFRKWVKNAEIFFIYHLVHDESKYSIKKFEKFTLKTNKQELRRNTILRT